MKQTRKAFWTSAVALLLCFSMLLGSTFAWFTDSANSNGNIVQSGNLDVEMYWSEELLAVDESGWQNAESGPIFTYDNWEPGYTDVKYIKVKNNGNLSFKWRLVIEAMGAVNELADVIEVYYVNPVTAEITSLTDRTSVGVLSSVIEDHTYTEGVLYPAGETATDHPVGETVLAVALHMQEKANNDYMGKSIGDGFTVRLVATQFSHEEDSFGKDYDKDALWPNNVSVGTNSASASVQTTAENKVETAVALQSNDGTISANVPAGVSVEQGTDKLTLRVDEVSESEANISLSRTEATLSVDVHIDGVAEDNDVVMMIGIKELLPVGLNMGNYRFYHVEDGATVAMTLLTDGATPAHNYYEYDPGTGDVVLYLKSFSEVALVADTVNPWNGDYAEGFAGGVGTEEAPYLIANADQLAYFGDVISNNNGDYGSAHYKLLADINLGGGTHNFYPIGYHKAGGAVALADFDSAPVFEFVEAAADDNDYAITPASTLADEATEWYTFGGAFSGTFDGDGHTVRNIYQNTWQLKGNYSGNYWNAAMGLFGYVNGGTVKNLTVDNFSSDGEFTPTGVIAAYATNSTFENIAITNCNPRVYNTGNGGIVGIGGNSDDPDTYKLTFTNITIDNTNTISALWGSWDVACGGLVGMFRGAGHVNMTNCHVAAQIDVYNDVCGNYQYYWYRYAGMMIGTNKNMKTDANGYTVPETDKFHAENCTVHFGEWNDYYYCELVVNSLASYTHDHQFSRLMQVDSVDAQNMTYTLDGIKYPISSAGRYNYVVVNGESATENATCYHFVDGAVWNHEDAGEETVGGETVLKEDKQHVYLPFNQLFTGYGWGVKHIPVYNGENYAFGGITILDREVADSVVKFESKFKGDYLYRVGNKNTVSLGSLFAAKADQTINNSGVWVTIEKVDENSNVGGTFTANASDWTKGTIQFSGTGVVKVTIQDYNFCTPTTLAVEVIDAVNATSATSAKSNNVVLLNDVGMSTIEVSGGYTLYGNGFKMTATTDPMYDTMRAGFVTLDNGILDNVQIICPNFSYAIIYNSQIKDVANTATPSDSSNDARGNVRSAVMVTGNSKIVNSYVHGGRAAIFLRSGNLLVDGSTISGGAAANIHALSAQSLTLRNATLIQKPFEDNVHKTGNTLMGFSVLLECGEDGYSTPVILEGTLIQDAWINESYVKYTPSAASSIVENALGKTAYLHDLDGDGKNESLNLGFTYIPQDTNGKALTDNLTDNRTDKAAVPYESVDVGTAFASAKVYSYKNTNGTSNDFTTGGEYESSTQGSTAPTVSFTDTNADRVFETKFDANDGRWESTLAVNLDNGNYTFSWDKLLMQKHGDNLTYSIKTVDGEGVDYSNAIALTATGMTEYVLTVADGEATHTVHFIITASKTSIPEPETADTTGGTPLLVVKSKNSDWSCAIPALEGIKIKYYTADGEVILDLATLTPTSTGKQNGTNNYWETTKDGYKLKVTCGVIHDTKSVYGMPVVVNNSGNKMYFTISSTNGYVSTSTSGRTVTLTYEFTDPNGKSLTFSKTWQFNYADYKSGKQYSYSDFVNGTLKEASSSCVIPDTLVTLADGTQKRIDQVSYADQLLVWNFYTGEYDIAPASIVMNHGANTVTVTTLTFSDGTTVNTINGHGFFDVAANAFVLIDEFNASDYIGHSFVKQDENGYNTVELVSYSVEEQYTEVWSLLTAEHYNCVLEGMWTVTAAEVDNSPAWLMPYAIGEDMKYDEAKMKADIETYGLYIYEDFADYCTYEQFVAFRFENFKVSVAKGYITWADIEYLLSIHIK
ncbi:MAG: hypothetical protein J6R04_02935 [Clostridia bacterium]|nr:hypothetical protein [Clostridia bacterium]